MGTPPVEELAGSEFRPYYWTKIGDEYLVLLRSKKGVQAYVLSTKTPKIALLELKDGAKEFVFLPVLIPDVTSRSSDRSIR